MDTDNCYSEGFVLKCYSCKGIAYPVLKYSSCVNFVHENDQIKCIFNPLSILSRQDMQVIVCFLYFL